MLQGFALPKSRTWMLPRLGDPSSQLDLEVNRIEVTPTLEMPAQQPAGSSETGRHARTSMFLAQDDPMNTATGTQWHPLLGVFLVAIGQSLSCVSPKTPRVPPSSLFPSQRHSLREIILNVPDSHLMRFSFSLPSIFWSRAPQDHGGSGCWGRCAAQRHLGWCLHSPGAGGASYNLRTGSLAGFSWNESICLRETIGQNRGEWKVLAEQRLL